MVIVTGANGFIGSAMVWELNQAGVPVLATVDLVNREQRPGPLAKRKFQDFLLLEEFWKYLEKPETISKVTWIIHMGANSSTTETNEKLLWEVNTHCTQRIFEWCLKHKKNLIYASSAATYGAGELGYSDRMDHERLRPLNLYGESKVKFDRWAVQQKQTPPHWYGLKFFNVYGPNEYHKEGMTSVPLKAFHQIQETGKLMLFQSHKPDYRHGEQMRDFVYVKDVTRWMKELMDKKPVSGIYNMGFGKARTWNALGGSVFESLKKPKSIEYIPVPENIRNQYQYFTEADMSTWESIGMSKAQWSVEEGVKDYVTRYLLNEDWYL